MMLVLAWSALLYAAVGVAEASTNSTCMQSCTGGICPAGTDGSIRMHPISSLFYLAQDSKTEGFAGSVVLAGHSSLSLDVATNAGRKTQELRHSAILFAEWLSERGGLDVAGMRYSLGYFLVDDGAAEAEVAPALQHAARAADSTFALGGYTSKLTKLGAKEARERGMLMVSAGASDASVFEADDLKGPPLVFGFLTHADMYIESIFQSVADFAARIDKSVASLPEGAECGDTGCVGSLRLSFVKYGYGCDDTMSFESLTSIAMQKFGQLAREEWIEADASKEELIAALERIRDDKATVLYLCSKVDDALLNVTSALYDMDYSVYALLGKGLTAKGSFRSIVSRGFWQGSYVLDTALWDKNSSRRGSYTKMTSREFSADFHKRWGYEPSYLAAAQFAALSSLSSAIEDADSLQVEVVAKNIYEMDMPEFYANIHFSKSGQLDFLPYVLQVPQPYPQSDPRSLEYFTYPSVWPEDNSNFLVFPMPTWAYRRCSFENVNEEGKPCYGRGLCSTKGQCMCEQGWQGNKCDILVQESSHLSTVDIALLVCFVPLLAIAIGTLWLAWRFRRRWYRKMVQNAEAFLEEALWDQDPACVEEAECKFHVLGYTSSQVSGEISGRKKRQSQEAGVGVAYILSDEFKGFACDRTGKIDPTFYDMKDSFFFGENPVGKDILCPRDGELGCALVDTLKPRHRKPCNRFLSWTWGYNLSTVQDALMFWTKSAELDPSDLFLFMCFFVNNQYRILVADKVVEAEELERTFEASLRRIGHVVALLDTWDKPRYFTRIWTIFEQLIAIKADIPVTMVLTSDAASSLLAQVDAGRDGIQRVMAALTKVQSEHAQAYMPADEEAVKQLIQKHFTFEYVDSQIIKFMLQWMSDTFQTHLKELVKQECFRHSTTGSLSSTMLEVQDDVRQANL